MQLDTQLGARPEDLRLANLARVRQTVQGALIHDLKGPLNAATLELDLLRQTLQKLDDPERLRATGLASVEAVRRELNRLNESLGTVTPLPDAMVADRVPLDPAALVAEAVHLTRQRAIIRGVRVELSRVDEPVEIVGERGPLLQAVLAVLLNALAATPVGGSIRIEADREDRGFRVVFEDSGAGFDEVALERAFEPHYSGNGAPGLGLTVAKGILAEHGGGITLGNGPSGAIVEITLPVTPADGEG